MESISIKSTTTTPEINFDSKAGTLEIKGISIPEDATTFYKPVIDSLEQYVFNSNSITTAEIQFVYFNTASTRSILSIFRQLEKLHQNGKKVIINWYYEEDDIDMFESGEDFNLLVTLAFNFKQIKPD